MLSTGFSLNYSKLDTFSLQVTLGLLLIIFLLFDNIIKTRLCQTARQTNKFPGARTLPFIGNCFNFIGPPKRIQKHISAYIEKYGRVSRLWYFSKPKFLLAEATAIEKVLSSPILIEKGIEYDKILEHFGDGLVTSRGMVWRKDRKALNPAFNRQQFDGFLNIFNKESRKLVETFGDMFDKDSHPKNLYPQVQAATMGMIFEAALGMEFKIQEETEDDYGFLRAVNTITHLMHIRLFQPWVYNTIAYKLLGYEKAERKAKDFMCRTVLFAYERMKEEMRDNDNNNEFEDKTKTKPFIQVLLELGPVPSEKACIDHLNTIAGAGTETTASSIYHTLFYLALHPEHQKKCKEELDAIFENDIERDLTMADLAKAKYLEACWKEGMRLRPPIPMIGRYLTQDLKFENGLTMKKGTDVVISFYDLHRDPNYFPDPERFDPERFSENANRRHAYSYLPFSSGIRNCIGFRYATIEAKLTLLRILSQFEVSSEQKQEDIGCIFGVSIHPYPAIELVLKKRQ